MVHVVRARKQGYAHRYPFGVFLGRFGHLTAGLTPNPSITDEFKRRYVGHTTHHAHLPYTAASIYGRYVGHGATDERCSLVALLAGMVSATIMEKEGWAVGRGKIFLKASAQQQACLHHHHCITTTTVACPDNTTTTTAATTCHVCTTTTARGGARGPSPSDRDRSHNNNSNNNMPRVHCNNSSRWRARPISVRS